ncbi:inner membrane protein [Candidatus Magnetomoraceae bacterium gMMP-15]
MADFKTHLCAASVISIVNSTILFGAGIASSGNVIMYFSLGIVGGILPDVDSNSSIPLRIMFNFFAVFFSFLAMFSQIKSYSIVELLLVWLAIYLVIRYLLFKVFKQFTVHRGLFHSIPAGFFFGFLTAAVSYHIYNVDAVNSWMNGFFICTGYIVHLIMDEIYSVDLVNTTLKRSFGSALKLFNVKKWRLYLFLYLSVIAMYYLAPGPETALDRLFNLETYQNIKNSFLPEDKWFENFYFWQ